MSATQTSIGEHDVVMLRTAVGDWPAGTRGTVVSIFPSHRWVEIARDSGEDFDIVAVRPEDLKLVRKNLHWGCEADVD